MKVVDVIYSKLLQNNIRHVFGYSGGAVLPLLDKFHHSTSHTIKFIKNSNESCSGFCASGYTKSLQKEKPGVIVSTSGPGVTNLITPLQDAMSDGVPLIAITGQVPTDSLYTNAFQECSAIELTKACTKKNYQVTDPRDISDIMDEAFKLSMEDRKGPIHIDIPKNIFMKETKMYFQSNKKQILQTKTYSNLENVKQLLHKSKKPILLIGQGCQHSYEKIREFSTKYSIPVTTTIHGMGIVSETDPLSLEMCGMHGNPLANIALQRADLIIGVGTRFDDRITGKLSTYGKGTILQNGIVHIDSSQKQLDLVKYTFDKHFENTNFLQQYKMDSYDFFDILNKTYHSRESFTHWSKILSRSKRNYLYYKGDPTIFKTPDVIECFNKTIDLLKINRDKLYISTGVGNHQMWTAQHITWTSPNKMITSGSLGTMGVGVPYAIGTKLANKGSMVLCIDGDSSFNMTSNELQTILENNIPLKIAIMNDKRQQMVYIWQKLFHNNNIVGTENKNPDYNLLSQAYNIKNLYCNSKNTLYKITEEFLTYNKGPIIAVFDVEPSMCFPLVAPGKSLDNMILSEKDITLIDSNQTAPN